MSTKKKTESRHGKLAESTVQTSFTMRGDLLEMAKKAAKRDRRSLSNFLGMVVEKHFGIEDRTAGE